MPDHRSMHRTRTSNVLVIGTGAAGWRAAIAATEAGVQVARRSASGRRSTRTPCSRRAGSTPRSGRATPRTPGSSTSPTRCARATSSGPADGRDHGARVAGRRAGAGRLGLRVRAHRGRHARPALLRRAPLAAHLLRGRLHRTRHPATVAAQGRRARAFRVEEDQYVSRLLVADGTCFGALAFDLHTGERTVHLADAVILRPAATRASGGAAPRAATRTTATACASHSTPVPAHGHGARPVPPDRDGLPGGGGGHAGHRGRARRGRAPVQRVGRALHGALRPRAARAQLARPGGARELHRDRRGARRAARRRVPRHHASGKEEIIAKLPRMYRQFIEWQMLDISREPMEVAPTAHYSMGGIVVEPETHATDVSRPLCGRRVRRWPPRREPARRQLARRGADRSAGGRARPRRRSPLAGEVFTRSRRVDRRGARRAGCADPTRAPSSPVRSQRRAARPDVGALRGRPRPRPACVRALRELEAHSAMAAPTSTFGRAPRAGPTSRTRSTCARARCGRGHAAGCARTARDARRAQPGRLPRPRPGAQVNFLSTRAWSRGASRSRQPRRTCSSGRSVRSSSPPTASSNSSAPCGRAPRASDPFMPRSGRAAQLPRGLARRPLRPHPARRTAG